MELWVAGCVVMAILLYPFVMGYLEYRRREWMIYHYNMMMMRARHAAEEYEMQQRQQQLARDEQWDEIMYTASDQYDNGDDDVELYYADDDEYR